MIGNIVTNPDTGMPEDGNGTALAKSNYQPPVEIMNLFARCQTDYGTAWQLQHRPFDEFDGVSLLQRANMDQQTFGAFVGANYLPQSKRWRWQGRKNTARNKIIAILSQLVSGMLIPTVYATDDQQNESRECARVMRILVQEHLRRADYEIKFIYMVLSALVNPATFVQVEYVEKMQTVKTRLASGEIKIEQAVDELMSGLGLNVVPIDEMLLGDFFTFNMQAQPYLIRIRRISYDVARGIYADRYFDEVDDVSAEGKVVGKKKVDRFDFVQAGRTRVFMTSQENQTLFDVDWTEGDRNMVQEATFYYRGEDIQVTWVGGVFMGNYDPAQPEDVYNINPFTHRRMTLVGDAWGSIPVYPFAKSGYEPLDPQMRFAYYKSVAFKEFWDDATLNMATRLMIDGMHLEVIKPLLVSGISKYDSNVIAPGAVAAISSADAKITPFTMSPNLAASMQVIDRQKSDMDDSTIMPILQGELGQRLSSTVYAAALANAKRLLAVGAALTADLIRQVGELTIDCIVLNTTIGEVNEQIPGALGMKFQTVLARGKEKGRDVTHRIVMTDKYMGRKMSEDQKLAREWELWHAAGGNSKNATKIWEVNPYQFARRRYSCSVDAEEYVIRSAGIDEAFKDKALAVMTSPAVAPFTDPEAVADDFAIDVYGGNDPDRYKRKGGGADPQAMMQMMGMGKPAGQQQPSEVDGSQAALSGVR